MNRNAIAANIPNLITLARIFAVPLLVWLVIHGSMAAAFWVFVAAGVSDALDGFVAKRFGFVTKLGSYLDPIADKALLVSAYVTLGQAGHISAWLVILVVFRDILIIGGTLLFHILGRPVEMQPLFISKFNTLVQILLVAVLLGNLGVGVPHFGLLPTLGLLVGVTTVLSGLAYLGQWVFGLSVGPIWRRDQNRQPAAQRGRMERGR
ncbi:MAG: CDP-alcohol phosphatidyltransferase family protein [Alphaproteobacteria bacterium]|nr:CDP-alcohol phosphatidyltransferase family protein [Alphaproteobacteria bacterium]